VFSLIILALTFPLWALPYHVYFKKRPLRPFYETADGQTPVSRKMTTKTWVYMGAGFGGTMWILMGLLPALTQRTPSAWHAALIGLPIWALGGLAFGVSMWFVCGRAAKNDPEAEPAEKME
jgi:type IV secretory pathway TrbD component